MPFDEGVAERLRDASQFVPDVVEKKMFGGAALFADAIARESGHPAALGARWRYCWSCC